MRYFSFQRSPRCILIALLAICVTVTVVQISWSVDIKYWKEARRQDYVLSLSYMDQTSWAATRLQSLQCWAARLKRVSRVVEPFVNDVYLGGPESSQAIAERSSFTFGDMYDVESLNLVGAGRGFTPLASWEDFLEKAPRKVVLVQIVYEDDYHCTENTRTDRECNHTRLRTFFTEFLEPHLFSVHSEICIDFKVRGFLTQSKFNELIFSGVLRNEAITLVFDEWRAMYPFVLKRDLHIKCFVEFKDVECSPLNPQMKQLTSRSLHPATNILISAQKYISLHLTSSPGFVAVLVRWEQILLYHFYRRWIKKPFTGNQCVKLIREYLEEIRRTKGITHAFLSIDVGKFGSSTFQLYNATSANLQNVTKHTEELIRYMYGASMTLEQYEQTLLDVSGTTNSVIISQVQKAVAAQAQCLLFVGSGSFHEHTLSMYKNLHKGIECYKIIEVC